MGPRAGLDGGREISPPSGFDPRTAQPVASRYPGLQECMKIFLSCTSGVWLIKISNFYRACGAYRHINELSVLWSFRVNPNSHSESLLDGEWTRIRDVKMSKYGETSEKDSLNERTLSNF